MRASIVRNWVALLLLGAALLGGPIAGAGAVFVTKESTRAALQTAREEARKTTIENDVAVAAARSVLKSNEQLNNVHPATLRAAEAVNRRAAAAESIEGGTAADEPIAGDAAEAPAPAAPAAASAGSGPDTAAAVLKVGEARILSLPATTESDFKAFIGEQLRVSNGVAVLPGAVEMLAADASEVLLKAFAFNSQPLKFNPRTRHYEGRVSVGVVNLENDGGVRQLASPITFQLLGPVTSEPDASIVTEMAPPYQHIAIASDRAMSDALEVSVVSNIHPGGQPLKLSFAPSLIMSVGPSRIQGWGLDTADIKIHTVGPYDGRERPIEIDADAGILVSADASLSTNGIANAVIRSSSIGPSVITASANGYPDAVAEIEFLFPTAFIVAALVGGLVGSIIAVATAGRSKGRKAAMKIGVGILCGVIVFGLYALGVNLIQFALPARAGELLVFVVSALGAMGGAKILRPPAPQ